LLSALGRNVLTIGAIMSFSFPAYAVIELLQLFKENEIDVIVDGGWGVDALLGHQTRAHEDLDIALAHKDVSKLREILEASGFSDIERDDTCDSNFVLGHPDGRKVDIHTYLFDDEGHHLYGCPYPLESLSGKGVIAGYDVKCIAPKWMVEFHTWYEPDENDFRDVQALCHKFGMPLPAIYERFLHNSQRPVSEP